MKNLNRQLGIQVTPIPSYMGGGYLNATGEESALKKKISSAKSKIRSLEKKRADEEVKLKSEQKKKQRGLAKIDPRAALLAGEKFNPIEGRKMVQQANVAIDQAREAMRQIEIDIAYANNEIADLEAQLASIAASEPTPSPAPRPTPSPSPSPTPSPSPSGSPSPLGGSAPILPLADGGASSTTDGGATSGGALGGDKKNTLLYVGIGVVVLGGIAYFVMKK